MLRKIRAQTHTSSKQRVDMVLQRNKDLLGVSSDSKENRSSFHMFVCTVLIVLFPVTRRPSLRTAGPATARTTNSLRQARSQMVLTLSWRVWTLSIRQQHVCKLSDEEPWRGLYVSTHLLYLEGVAIPGVEDWSITGVTNIQTCTLTASPAPDLHVFILWGDIRQNPISSFINQFFTRSFKSTNIFGNQIPRISLNKCL